MCSPVFFESNGVAELLISRLPHCVASTGYPSNVAVEP
jgi:hypothetical protein